MTDALADWCASRLGDLAAEDLLRTVVPLETPSGPRIRVAGREMVLMCSNDYLGLAADTRLAEAAKRAADEWGTGSGASRLVSGATRLHAELEARLASHEGTEDCVLFSSGYLANIGTIAALVGPGDTVVSDALNHASIIDGCRLSRAEVRTFPHADAEAAAAQVAAVRGDDVTRRILLVTDSVFSMDGDIAPLAELAHACRENDAWLMVDEAHATGLFDGGRGAVHAVGVAGDVDVLLGTCSKALGSLGGFVAGSRALCDWLRNRARSFVYDTSLPGSAVAASLAALDIVQTDDSRRRRLHEHTRRLATSLTSHGWDVMPPSAAIVPVVVGSAADALRIGEILWEHGVFARPIRPPTVPAGSARIRLCPMATHDTDDIDLVIEAFAACRREIGR
ncbi:MAG: 8-amino-7-oxononanoate synthase [Acidimicrobiia bacterium]|nr:8-amino-7-oxononanoate synthase [Acidimicrobiia bacterium]